MDRGMLRALMICKYGSVTACAKALGWSQRKASYLVNGNQQPTADDINLLAVALDVKDDPEKFCRLFFSK